MFIKIESASKVRFEKEYSELLKYFEQNKYEYTFIRDEVSFGDINSDLIAQLFFVFESIRSGISYDLLINLVKESIKTIPREKRKNIYVSVIDGLDGSEYDISLDYENENIKIEIPDKLKIAINKWNF